MSHAELLPPVRREVAGLLNGYLDTVEVGENIDGYITAPALGSKSGVLGAIALAERT
jgi:fructokinase